MSSKQRDIQTLRSLTDASQIIISEYLTILSPQQTSSSANASTTTNPQTPAASLPHPLQVLRDASLLLKSHITKLSLLLLNPPFTPSAITPILREITSTCLPAMMSAVQIAQPDIWGEMLCGEIKACVRRVMRECRGCLDEVRKVIDVDDKVVKAVEKGKGTLACTRVMWDACDTLIGLEDLEIGGVALRKAEEYHDLIKDAIEELKEWGEGHDDGNEDGDDDDDDDKDDNDFDEEDDDLFGENNRIPKNRPDIKTELDIVLDKLKKITFLYTAVIKRRIKTFTKEIAKQQTNVQRMDEIMDKLKSIPESIDDLASAFYDLDIEEINSCRSSLLTQAKNLVSIVHLNWSGSEDEFTTWCQKWIEVTE